MRDLLVVDLFAGAGGLGEGLESYSIDGFNPFSVSVSVESDLAAAQTLTLRKFFRAFEVVPSEYYSYLRGEVGREWLQDNFPDEWRQADSKVFNEELGDNHFTDNELHRILRKKLKAKRDWILVGGPPCQAYSQSGRSRNKGVKGYLPEEDHRHFLYEQYLKVIAEHAPPIFLMENVPGILSSRVNGELIFPKILRDLENPGDAVDLPRSHKNRGLGYKLFSLSNPVKFDMFHGVANSYNDFIVKADEYGVPQSRHRVFILGVRLDLKGEPRTLVPRKERLAVRDVLEGLPKIRSALSSNDSDRGWSDAIRGIASEPWLKELEESGRTDRADRIRRILKSIEAPRTGSGGRFIESKSIPNCMNEWFLDARIGGTIQHESRSHMERDLHRYIFTIVETLIREEELEQGKSANYVPVKMHEFPKELLPEHKNLQITDLRKASFSDRFRVQRRSAPSTTIVSHMGNDGHYYIHYDPTQCRTLTLREAARLQTFPDNYYFEGNKGDTYRQVGNAVPPYLAMQIAEVMFKFLDAQ